MLEVMRFNLKDFGFLENKVAVPVPTGTADAMVRVDNEWIEIDATQAWFWTEEWQAGENKVEEYIHEGNVQTFDTAEEFLRSLRE